MKKIIILFGISAVILFILSFLSFFIFPGGFAVIKDIVLKKLQVNQTVGQVTVNRTEDKILITKVVAPGKNELSPIIGDAYKIEKIASDDEPIRVEFAYDPSLLKEGVSESTLSLYKWHEGTSGYWYKIPSTVNTDANIVIADLNSFSILAVRAPLAYYTGQRVVDQINSELQEIFDEMPRNTCGMELIVDEELLEFEDGEAVDGYNIPIHIREDCIGDPSAPPHIAQVNFAIDDEKLYKIGNTQSSKKFDYFINAILRWQTDPNKKAEITGIVTNQHDKPLSGVIIHAEKNAYDTYEISTVTDADGKYQLHMPSGKYDVTANTEGYESTAEKSDGDLTVPGKAGSNLSNPKTENKRCEKKEWKGKLYAFGELPDDLPRTGLPSVKGPWNINFQLQCSDYYIDEQIRLPYEFSGFGLTYTGTEIVDVSGYVKNPIRGGYGWEGIWEIDAKYSNASSVSGIKPGVASSRDRIMYLIKIPIGVKKGDSVEMIFGRYDGSSYWQNLSLEGWESSGSGAGASGYTKSAAQIKEFMGEDGLYIQVLGSDRYPALEIKKIKK